VTGKEIDDNNRVNDNAKVTISKRTLILSLMVGVSLSIFLVVSGPLLSSSLLPLSLIKIKSVRASATATNETVTPIPEEPCPTGHIRDASGNCVIGLARNTTEVLSSNVTTVGTSPCGPRQIPYSEGVKSFINCVYPEECSLIGGTVVVSDISGNAECTFLNRDRYNCGLPNNVCNGTCTDGHCDICRTSTECPKAEVCEGGACIKNVCMGQNREPWFGACIPKCTGGKIRVAGDPTRRIVSPYGFCVCPFDKPLERNGVCQPYARGPPGTPVPAPYCGVTCNNAECIPTTQGGYCNCPPRLPFFNRITGLCLPYDPRPCPEGLYRNLQGQCVSKCRDDSAAVCSNIIPGDQDTWACGHNGYFPDKEVCCQTNVAPGGRWTCCDGEIRERGGTC
jgi:hypothetical protein